MNSLFKNYTKKVLPKSLKERLAGIAGKVNEEYFRYQLKRKNWTVPDDGIHLSYAGGLAPGQDGVVHGGRVKLIHLSEKFPEQEGVCNILYLVSSAVPQYPEILIKYLKDRDCKLVWNQNGVAFPAWAHENYKAINSRLSSLLKMADYVIYQSDFCRISADRYLGKPNSPGTILYNPVDVNQFTPADVPPSRDVWRLLITGSHQQPDRVFLILKALSELKNRGNIVKLLIAGRLDWPNAHNETLAAIKELNLVDDVELLGSYTQDQAPRIYQSAHVVIHIQYKDACPTVPIEAMSCGIPVVGSRSGGIKELVSFEAGILLDVPDSWDEMYYPQPGEIADAVESIMCDFGNWSKNARHRAMRNYSKLDWQEEHHKIFTELV